MTTTLSQLQVRRAKLLQELKSVTEAIASFADASPVKIETGKNLRNTKGLTTNPEEAERLNQVLVFADEAMTEFGNKSSHDGYISKAALAQYQMEYSDWSEWLQISE